MLHRDAFREGTVRLYWQLVYAHEHAMLRGDVLSACNIDACILRVLNIRSARGYSRMSDARS